jgi:EmrB/QacA subfamily drug resistance transporter
MQWLSSDDPRMTAPRRRPEITLAVLALAGISYALMQSLVAPALPVIQTDLHTTARGASWIFTAYLLSASIATPLIGRLGDIHGKRRVLVAVMVLLFAGTLLSAVATSIVPMIAGRIVQGVAGGMFPLAFGIIRDEFPRERVPGSIGFLSALLGIGGGLGIVLSGVIADHLSYHWLFWLPLAPIALGGVGVALLIPESPVRAPARINWLATLLLSAGLATLLFGLSNAVDWGWGSPRTLGLAAASLALLAAWVRVELGAHTPLVDMRIMRRRGVWTTNLAAALIGSGMYSGFVLIPQFAETPTADGFGFGSSVTGAGLLMLPMTLAMLVTGAAAGRLELRFGSRLALVAGTIATAASFLVLTLAHAMRGEVLIAGLLMGAGIGLAFAALPNLIVEAVPPDQTGVATGINTIARTIGGGFGTQIAGTAIAASVAVAGGDPTVHGFTVAFAIITGLLALATLAALAIPGRPRRAEPELALEPAAA